MCGIYASVSKHSPVNPPSDIKELLCRRGPDHVGESDARMKNGSEAASIFFASTVLALRGGHVAAQPLKDAATGSVLCWNGEAWRIGHELVEGNDGEAILHLLASRTSEVSLIDSVAVVLEVIQSISGPFAFIYFDKVHDMFYFGRDCLGRRSLLINQEDISDTLQISSVAGVIGGAWREVEADGVYVLGLSSLSSHPSLASVSSAANSKFSLCRGHGVPSSLQPVQRFINRINSILPHEIHHLDSTSSSVKELESQLHGALKLRVLNIPTPPATQGTTNTKLAILFSGGLDCTVLARMAHDILSLNIDIDLLNVAFENPRVIQAAKSRPSGSSQQTQNPVTEIILDSGGNTTILALHRVPRTDLNSAYESCPDRITGKKAVRELRLNCPGRVWRFVEVNVPYAETKAHREKVVSLMYPHNTEMDLSISFALYFASRGIGLASVGDDMPPVDYMTQARVVLSGLGADELFGGYTRHATAFERRGFSGLINELELDVSRLGKRNLGRDDRIIANWGREARYPYLDESLLKWALETPVWRKCGFGIAEQKSDEAGSDLEPGKKVLRLLALNLGMSSVAREKKRAIQFGARTAKMETGRTKGTSHIS